MKSTGYILNGAYHTINGVYHPGKFTRIVIKEQLETTIIDKQYQHDRQREEHRRDLIQPYKDGKPNSEFIEQYPEESQQYGFN
jgi:hypothetical protein